MCLVNSWKPCSPSLNQYQFTHCCRHFQKHRYLPHNINNIYKCLLKNYLVTIKIFENDGQRTITITETRQKRWRKQRAEDQARTS